MESLDQEARRILGETSYDDLVKPSIDAYMAKDRGEMPIDTGLLFLPGLDRGLLVFGPHRVQDMWKTMLERLYRLDPELAKYRDLKTSVVVDKLIREVGAVAFFGESGKLTQIAALRERRLGLKPESMRQVRETFETVEPELLRWASYDRPRDPVRAKDVFGAAW